MRASPAPNTLLLLMGLSIGGAAHGASPARRVAVEVAAVQNTFDGCEACGCRAKQGVGVGSEGKWWISFGIVAAAHEQGWEALTSSSHCAGGSFEDTSGDFRRTVGTPYVILDLAVTPALDPTGSLGLHLVLSLRRLTGFGKDGQPVYDHTMQRRVLNLATEDDMTLPLFIPDQRESQAFGVHEVLLTLKAQPLPPGPASYGKISVAADQPGVEILLDGGLVGRIAEGRPTLLRNVLAGEREIRLRDYSGREAHKSVLVEDGGVAEVSFDLLPPASSAASNDLAPIGRNQQGCEEYWRRRDGAIVVRVPAGEFLMGSPDGTGQPDERPQRSVYVSEFLIDKTEVSRRQLRKFAQATEIPTPPAPIWGADEDYPAANVVWEEAQAYCEWAGGRLPTEAEWEKAARGTDGRVYPWGDPWDPRRCNSISGGPHRPEPVGSFRECLSPYGLLDLAGSVWEWCADWYDAGYYSESAARDPRGPSGGRARVLRGGAWMSQPLWLRAAHRFKVPPASRNADHGFRCVQDPPE